MTFGVSRMIDFSHDFLRKKYQHFEIRKIQPENQKIHGKVHLQHWGHFFIGQSLTPDTPPLTISHEICQISAYIHGFAQF